MKTHFAPEATENETIEARIDEFRNDSQKMEVLSDFIEDVIKTAEVEAQQKKLQECQQRQPKEKSSAPNFTIGDFKNGKVVNRARGLVVRLFDAICNCANSAAAPAQRMRRKRSSEAK